MDNHLGEFYLMECGQRGAKEGCSGTSDNLMIDRMVTMNCQRGKPNVSMARVGVKKAYDSMANIMEIHRFPYWYCRVIRHVVPS